MLLCRFVQGLVSLAALLLIVSPAAAEGDLVARVGSVPITKYELQREIRKRVPLEMGYHAAIREDKLEQIRTSSLDQLIERAYKVQYALASELVVPETAVEERMQPALAKYPDREQLLAALGGESLEALRASVRRQLLAEMAEQAAVDSKVAVTDQELQEYYSANRQRYYRPLQFKASHILVQVDPAANAEEQAKRQARAAALLARARAGEDFYNLAYYESDERSRYVGGSLGYFHEGQTVEEFDKAVKALKPGEISGLVRTRWGFHIIKLDERKEARQLEYGEVKEQLRRDLEKERRTALYKGWIDDLRRRYPVEMVK